MTVTITIDIDDPAPVIPKSAVVGIAYGDQARRIEYTFTGRSLPSPTFRYVVHDRYQMRTFNELSYSDTEVTAIRTLPDSHPIGAPGYVPDSEALAREIARHLDNVLPTLIAIDMNSREH